MNRCPHCNHPLSIKEKIIDELRAGHATVFDLSAELEIYVESVRRAVNELVHEGRVKKDNIIILPTGHKAVVWGIV